MGQHLQIEWQETADQLQLLYRLELNAQRRIRLQAFWQLRRGRRIQEVAESIGVCYRTIQYWVAWYRGGGLAAVLRRIPGHGNGSEARLTGLQQRALVAKVALGLFRTVWDAIQWVRDRWNTRYSYSGLHRCLQRLTCAPKVPRPQSVKADPQRQSAWKEHGLRDALEEVGVQPDDQVWFCDEMRFGLWGQVRRRWGRKGVKIIQKVQIEFAWQYLVLAVDVLRCELRWAWVSRMNQAQLLPIFHSWSPDAVVWDGASAHRGQAMGQLGFARLYLPPYSPELNPPERVFEVLRQAVEGQVYPSLQGKRHAIDQELRRLNANKPQLRALIGWDWIRDAFQQLPIPDIPSP